MQDDSHQVSHNFKFHPNSPFWTFALWTEETFWMKMWNVQLNTESLDDWEPWQTYSLRTCDPQGYVKPILKIRATFHECVPGSKIGGGGPEEKTTLSSFKSLHNIQYDFFFRWATWDWLIVVFFSDTCKSFWHLKLHGKVEKEWHTTLVSHGASLLNL